MTGPPEPRREMYAKWLHYGTAEPPGLTHAPPAPTARMHPPPPPAGLPEPRSEMRLKWLGHRDTSSPAIHAWADAEVERQNVEIEALCERSVEAVRHWLGPFRPTAFPIVIDRMAPFGSATTRTVTVVVGGVTVGGVAFLPPTFPNERQSP